ncbi:MAG: DivIVA domain-containing protein, partial [Ignavibacteriaceae bacterium]|nr:DivIVA domain-containing protein [Ignavibacteriaceae bacterium]
MRTTPSNIRQQEFNKTLRGYDTEEVKGYLSGLAEELDEILTENERLRKQLDEAMHKLGEYRKMEKSLQETVVRVQENS